jgi:hypothetical protein
MLATFSKHLAMSLAERFSRIFLVVVVVAEEVATEFARERTFVAM